MAVSSSSHFNYLRSKMLFHLQFPITPLPEKFDHQNKIVMTGSCFAEEIGCLMERYKFPVQLNPNGILYDPQSISEAVSSWLVPKAYSEKDLFFYNDTWNSLKHHGRFSHPDKSACLGRINASREKAHTQLKNAKWLVITFGSAWMYRHKASNSIAANCHKLPARDFDKELADEAGLEKTYTDLFEKLRTFNPSLNILLTVSPVRYVRDGVVENNLSKAVLIKLVHSLVNAKNVFYFPAYELVTDDLRDYRFFKEDLVHPNEPAINYVWEKFTAFAFDEHTMQLHEKVKEVVAAAHHRTLHPGTTAHRIFAEKMLDKCRELSVQFPFLDLEKEKIHFGNEAGR
ncbi:MAG TPA: GSCFA domain-containing protein [Bacteroidia bacterium]|jgi:hypothetical protein